MNRSTASLSAVGLVLGLVGCGGGRTGSANPAPANPDLTVVGLDIKLDKTEYDAKAGDVKIAYTDKGKQSHSLIIEDANKKRVGVRLAVDPGESAGQTVTLAPGTYLMYCDVPGHRQSMNAKLVVG